MNLVNYQDLTKNKFLMDLVKQQYISAMIKFLSVHFDVTLAE